MRTPPLKLIVPLLLLLIFLFGSCAHNPKTFKETESIMQGRQDYVQLHPDGMYNEHILKGEVVKGMNLMEVLASWGLPNARRRSEGGSREYWTYYTQEEQSGDIREYELVFKEQSLVRWKITLSVAEGGYHPEKQKYPIELGDKGKIKSGEVLKKK